MSQHHRVTREELSVREHMSLILRRLRSGGFAEFGDLFEPTRGVPVLIVNFLAVLELVREKPSRGHPVRALRPHLRETRPCSTRMK